MSTQSKSAISFEPFREQEEFLRADKRYLGYISGVGAGKTYAGIIRTFLNMEEWNPGEMGAIVAPTRQMIVNVIIPEMRELGLMNRWEYKSSYSDEPGLHSPNGSRALLLSADNERTIERLRGLNLAWWWMDEESEIDPRARQILEQRLRTGTYRNGYATTTPKGKNHTWEFFVNSVDAKGNQFGEATLYEGEDRLAIVGVPTHANPHTPEDYKESMENLPDEIRAQEVQGQFVEIGSGVFKLDMLNFTPAEEISDEWRLNWIIGVDPATEADANRAEEQDSDYWSATLIAVHRRMGRIFVIDNNRKRGMSLRQGVSWLSSIAGEIPSPSLYVESNAAQTYLVQELANEGLNATPVNTTQNKEERLIDLSIPIENGTVEFVNQEIDESLGYDPRWQEMISEMLAFPDGRHDDAVDSLDIAVRNAGVNTHTIMGANPFDKDE